jgi:hypothetical protein
MLEFKNDVRFVFATIWGLVTLGDLTWARPLALIRSGHLECQVSRSSYPAIDFSGSNWLYIIYLYNWVITVTGTKNVKTSIRSKWRILHYGRNTKTRAFPQTTGREWQVLIYWYWLPCSNQLFYYTEINLIRLFPCLLSLSYNLYSSNGVRKLLLVVTGYIIVF